MSEHKFVKVWDLPVRIFHWSLVTFFVISYISGEELESVHAWAGYAVIALVLFRIFWGFVGTRHARFSDFIFTSAEISAYVKSMLRGSPKHYLGHNPAGGLMIMALLISLLLTTWSGLEAYAVEGHGPLANAQLDIIASACADGREDDHDDDGLSADQHGKGEHESDEFWEEVHEFFANVTLLLVFIHIAGVFVASYLHKENLVKAMIYGNKEIP